MKDNALRLSAIGLATCFGPDWPGKRCTWLGKAVAITVTDVNETSQNVLWTKLLGTSGSDYAYAFTTGIDGSIYMSGYTDGNLDGSIVLSAVGT